MQQYLKVWYLDPLSWKDNAFYRIDDLFQTNVFLSFFFFLHLRDKQDAYMEIDKREIVEGGSPGDYTSLNTEKIVFLGKFRVPSKPLKYSCCLENEMVNWLDFHGAQLMFSSLAKIRRINVCRYTKLAWCLLSLILFILGCEYLYNDNSPWLWVLLKQNVQFYLTPMTAVISFARKKNDFKSRVSEIYIFIIVTVWFCMRRLPVPTFCLCIFVIIFWRTAELWPF